MHAVGDMLVARTVTMNRVRAVSPRLSSVACVGMATLALLVGAPVATAHAAEDDPAPAMAEGTEAPLTELRERLTEKRHDAARHLGQLLSDVFDRSASRVSEARRQMELVVTFGHGLEGFMQLDASAFVAPESEEPATQGQQERFEYVEGTHDPLAGL
jgi:hypothetical protein